MSRVQELEREIAATRARLNGRIDEIQSRLTVSGIVDEVMGQSGVPRLASGQHFVADLLRKNPVPVMLAAAAVGFLVYRMNKRAAPAPAADRGGRDGPYILRAAERDALRPPAAQTAPAGATHLPPDPSV